MKKIFCAYCKVNLAVKEYSPFCSDRCKDVDLYKWFNGSYSIPAYETDDIDESELEKLEAIQEEENNN